MMGNVYEILESVYGETSYEARSSRRGRGGSHLDRIFYDMGMADSLDFFPSNEMGKAGFRVASDVPEPATLSLLTLGGLALIRRRRK